jgi:LmbE family N-acetylglucosaminyl deacetylase
VGLTVAKYFEAADRLPFVPLERFAGNGGVVVVSPHPDDETLGCGGLIALCAEERRPCRIVVVSDGTGSHPNSKRWPSDALRNLRENEVRDALSQLGISETAITFLRLPDRGVPIDGPAADAAVATIASVVQSIDATALFVTWQNDPHCDHRASSRLARRAQSQLDHPLTLLSYPIWGHTLAEGEFERGPTGSRLPIDSVLALKQRAIRCHASQTTSLIDDDPHGFMLTDAMIARFERPFETFFREDGP